MTTDVVTTFSALGDATRWGILTALGAQDASASALAKQLSITRQAIAKHLAVLHNSGLVERVQVGREVRYRAIGARLSDVARQLDSVGAQWDRRLDEIRRIAEGL